MSENPEAFCGGGEGVPTETRSLDYDSWGYYGESGGYFQADVEFIAVDGFELDCSVDACIPIIGRRFPVTQTVCVNGLCREYAEVLIEDLMQIDELRESAAGGWVEEIIDFFFPATVKVKVCSDPRAAAYRHVTKDDGPLVRAVWARGLFMTLYPNTTATSRIDVIVTWSDGTEDRFGGQTMAVFEYKETLKDGSGVAGSAC